MKKTTIILTILALILLTGCNKWQDRPPMYKEIEPVPNECAKSKDDVCELFDCMVDQCWCSEISPDGAILSQGSIVIENEEQAMQVVYDYFFGAYEEGELYGKMVYRKVKKAVKINNVFYNVFVDEHEEGNEVTYTVAVDGTIIKTICGV